jgi:predicted DNA binding CopG/RHH family protein
MGATYEFRINCGRKKIEETADQLRPVSDEKRKKIEGILNRARKNQAISLRVSEFDLEMIKRRAEAEGLPYQTLINTVLHKYVTDQLYDKREFQKALAGIVETKAM